MADGDVSVTYSDNRGFPSYVCNGTNSIVSITTEKKYFNCSVPFSISFWVKGSDTAAAGRGIMGSWKTAGDLRNWGFAKTNGNKIYWYVSTDGSVGNVKTTTGSIDITDNLFHHIVGIWDGSNIYVYTDKVVSANAACTAVTNNNTDPTKFGTFSTATNPYWLGQIANVKFFNVALTLAEVTKLYANERVERGLVYDWKFLNGSYTDSEKGLTGTNANGHIAIASDQVGAAIKAQRTSADDKFMLFGKKGTEIGCVQISE